MKVSEIYSYLESRLDTEKFYTTTVWIESNEVSFQGFYRAETIRYLANEFGMQFSISESTQFLEASKRLENGITLRITLTPTP